MPLQDAETVIFVMLENRSFDHMLGYLNLPQPAGRIVVEGLRDDPAWLDAMANAHDGRAFRPTQLSPDVQQMADPPHDHLSIARQIALPRPAGPAGPEGAGMGGFVASYMTREPPPDDPSAVMGYYDAAAVPIYDFFARNFTVCDHWFASVPCGTQPNRLMAMAGHSAILDNASGFLPEQELVYDWLTDRAVAWCTYQSGDFLPFFALMAGWLPEITTSLALSALGGRGRFRRYARFREHWLDAAAMPDVVFIEPEYTDGPHADPNDDHPPTGVALGQAFLADIYATLIANPARWQRTVMIVTYDEHGGFFDHVQPLPIPATLDGTAVASTGVRVPAFIVSPLVAPGVPFTEALDHTSFLQLLADRFTPGLVYSTEVAARQTQLGRLAQALTGGPSATTPVLPTAVLDSLAAGIAGAPRSSLPADTANATATTAAFQGAATKLATDHADLLAGPGWTRLAAYLAGASTAA